MKHRLLTYFCPVALVRLMGFSNEPKIPNAEVLDQIAANMVAVEGGEFLMGAAPDDAEAFDDERPQHCVKVDGFQISRYEVTQRQYRELMVQNPIKHKGCDDCPVENVSWNDAQTFIARLNAFTGKSYRLPTEAEWEYAARGGNKSKGYIYAGSNVLDKVAWYGDNSDYKTHPVGQKQANELGLYDMSGNVYEWCGDWYDAYPFTAQTNPKGPFERSGRVLRGGSWEGNAKNCRVSLRYPYYPDLRGIDLGFRLVLP